MSEQSYFCFAMNIYLPRLLKLLFPSLIWDIKTDEKEIFLTFDDGPNPDVTTQVLDILDDHNAQATFFCVGENVQKHPDIYQLILTKGHKTGNHTFNHLNGWKTPDEEYYHNIHKCAEVINSHLFRPPFGRIKPVHIPYLKMQFRVIMWTVLTEDYVPEISPEKCFKKSIQATGAGSIVVFHDSIKASNNMLYALPRFLDYFSKLGYRFSSIQV